MGTPTVSYYISTRLNAPFGQAIGAAEEALKSEGFGIISRIDIQATLKAKIGADFHPYTILGACNPTLAFEALKLEDKVGTMLPCNVVVQGRGDNETEVAAIDPVASMQAIDNAELLHAAEEVRARLARVIGKLHDRPAADSA
jgi:uncharacterized protein (DUF302 family)